MQNARKMQMDPQGKAKEEIKMASRRDEQRPQETKPLQERVVVVGLITGSTSEELEEADRSLDELGELALAAGAVVVGRISQRRPAPDPATVLGKGKIDELAAACAALTADTVIFDDELTGAQIRNISQITDCKVIDRTLLILDIFARRARSHEGKLQVEMAQLQYRLSHLTGFGRSLSRLGGGIGTRGPGETKLESDRRHINRRIATLRKALSDVAIRRDRLRQRRHDNEMMSIAVVGYTNAGKSTLINTLCAGDLFTADQVFATLDPSVRRLMLPSGNAVLMVDTVGLIRRLPHHLVDAFHATLEEVADADLILEVIDAASPDAAAKMAVVEQLLDQLGASTQPRYFVFNKMDMIPGEPAEADLDTVDHDPSGLIREQAMAIAASQGRQVFPVSALTGAGLDALRQALADFASAHMLSVELLLPYSQAALLDLVRQNGRIDSVTYLPEGIQASVHVRYSQYAQLRPYLMLAENSQER